MARADALGYRPLVQAGVEMQADHAANRRQFALEKGLEIEFRIRDALEPIPAGFAVVLVEVAAWEELRHRGVDPADVREFLAEPHFWEGGESLPGEAVIERILRFEDLRSATVRGLAPGAYRFKVFPDGIEVEPNRIELDAGVKAPMEISWRRKAE